MIMVTFVDTTGLCTHNIGVTSGSGVHELGDYFVKTKLVI